MNIREENRKRWDRQVENQNEWTIPVSAEAIAKARNGELHLLLTPSKPVPRDWYPPLKGAKTLCLASGGGQQGPALAAAGADVVVFDNSPLQLKQDEYVARRENLKLETIEGDMRDLSVFRNETFDLIFHTCSNTFVPDIRPVWNEAFRTLKRGGTLLSGISNPIVYLFDPELEKQGIHQLRFTAPYSDLTSLGAEEREKYYPHEPLSFGHALDDQIGGQIDAGFHIVGFFEDDWNGRYSIDKYLKTFIATRGLKPG